MNIAYRKVASSRPVYYSILDSFGQRSQYIRIKFPLHKQSRDVLLTKTGYCSRLYGIRSPTILKLKFRLNVAFWQIFLKLVMLWVFKYLLPSYANYYFSCKKSWNCWVLHKHFKNCVFRWKRKLIYIKGQIISECPYEIIVSPKIPTKKFPRFLP